MMRWFCSALATGRFEYRMIPQASRKSELRMRTARSDDGPRLQAIRHAAFAPIFASFHSILGAEIYELVQRRDDDGQEGLLTSLLASDSPWVVYVAELGDEAVGFVAIRVNRETSVGEIGLNAIHPAHAGKGFGTAMYEFALAFMTDAGMKVATVATGGDPSHAPARRAYRKAGFDREVPSVWMHRKL
jgi:GNAT superfamily N-acetyltransferase